MTTYSRGNRIFFDSATGVKLWETGPIFETTKLVAHQEIVGQIDFIDLEVNSYDHTKVFIASINPETKEPVFEAYPTQATEDQMRIKQLEEDVLLLQTDANEGGIL